MRVITTDGKEWPASDFKLVCVVKKVRDREMINPPRVGLFPVFIDRNTTRMFTYSRKIKEIIDNE